jgi:hypothetical protein
MTPSASITRAADLLAALPPADAAHLLDLPARSRQAVRLDLRGRIVRQLAATDRYARCPSGRSIAKLMRRDLLQDPLHPVRLLSRGRVPSVDTLRRALAGLPPWCADRAVPPQDLADDARHGKAQTSPPTTDGRRAAA